MELQFFNVSEIKSKKEHREDGNYDWIRLTIMDNNQEHTIDLFSIGKNQPLEILEG